SENRLVRYFRDTRAEIAKVTWPTREEGLRLTGIVLIVTVVSGAFLWLADSFFGFVVTGLLQLM
ncbi:MAG: preprotein translocase subunit SecE, partial [Caldilineaceae bacterium]